MCNPAYIERIEEKLAQDDISQHCLLSIWKVELCLAEINRSDENVKAIEKLRNLLTSKEKFLDKNTVYQLLQQSGRLEEFLFFAEVKVN
jgi:hypothetical protein